MAPKKKTTVKTAPASGITCEELEKLFCEYREKLPYANTNDGSTYGGWVSNFHIHPKGHPEDNMKLVLNNKADLFLLFVLAVAWSRSGQWENSAFFVSYLKLVRLRPLTDMDEIRSWVDEELKGDLSKLGKMYAEEAAEKLRLDSGIDTNSGARHKISLRQDTLKSIKVLMKNWDEIQDALDESEAKNDYSIFWKKMRSIPGLGPTKKQTTNMSMKILLILRELRIQAIYKNIPGKLCCVPDARVKKAAKSISDLKLKSSSDFDSHVKNSEIIYQKFGDWYDVLLFAYEDILRVCQS